MSYLAQYIGAGGTSGALGNAAVDRLKAAGYSASQINSMAAQQGYTLGAAVQSRLGGSSGSSSAARSVDAGSGASYAFREVSTPTHGNVRVAGPMTDDMVQRFLAGDQSAILPASRSTPDQPYSAPAGTNYVRPDGSIGVGQGSSHPLQAQGSSSSSLYRQPATSSQSEAQQRAQVYQSQGSGDLDGIFSSIQSRSPLSSSGSSDSSGAADRFSATQDAFDSWMNRTDYRETAWDPLNEARRLNEKRRLEMEGTAV